MPDKRGREEWLVEKMIRARKVEICKAMGGRRLNGEGGRRKASREHKCNRDIELERWGGGSKR